MNRIRESEQMGCSLVKKRSTVVCKHSVDGCLDSENRRLVSLPVVVKATRTGSIGTCLSTAINPCMLD